MHFIEYLNNMKIVITELAVISASNDSDKI